MSWAKSTRFGSRDRRRSSQAGWVPTPAWRPSTSVVKSVALSWLWPADKADGLAMSHAMTRNAKGPASFDASRFTLCSPEGIRTLATALRGRRPRPLDDGARTFLLLALSRQRRAELYQKSSAVLLRRSASAGVPGLEPRLTEPESVGLPITPYPIWLGSPCRERTLPDPPVATKPGYPNIAACLRAHCS